MTPGGHDTISQLGQLKQLPAKVPKVTSVLESPTREKSAFMDVLKKLVSPEERGSEMSATIFREISEKNPQSPVHCELVFEC